MPSVSTEIVLFDYSNNTLLVGPLQDFHRVEEIVHFFSLLFFSSDLFFTVAHIPSETQNSS